MSTSIIKHIVFVTSMAWGVVAIAAPMSKADYQAGSDKLSSDYVSAKEGCNSLAGNARDVCIVRAKGNNKVAQAELEAAYKPSANNQTRVKIARTESEHATAIERCNSLAAEAKDVCVKEADTAAAAAKADIKAQVKATSEADKVAAEDKQRDARYAAARDKCNTFAGDVKDRCTDKAKSMHDSEE
ncbi:MAG TPA: hypothetical protein VL550_06695 [Rhodocyclaceae bacterium]|jgi:hypothetical protein|nr:hypothetical protein [Rhodocyclaceae bacterium]